MMVRASARPICWRFRLEPVPGGVRVIASAAGGDPADWVVPVR